ncbi:MAG: hypothetical protein MGG37_14025 [Trichodesmium sp. MAG_R01]|nr:hypothetical protein [Trichodesmium sp. MAG_R01]
MPTGNIKFPSWLGGIFGSVALNDEYNNYGKFTALFATNAIDGYLYIGCQNLTIENQVKGLLKKFNYDTPIIKFKHKIGPSISIPIFTDGKKLVRVGYNGVYLFNLNWEYAKSDEKNALSNNKK